MTSALALLTAVASQIVSALGWLISRPLAWITRREERAGAVRQRQFSELYRPLYERLIAAPPLAPVDSFADAEAESLAGYLALAQKLVRQHTDVADRSLLDRQLTWDEILALPDRSHLERECRWVYRHVEQRFHRLRRELGLG